MSDSLFFSPEPAIHFIKIIHEPGAVFEVPNAPTQAYLARVMGEIPSDIADRVSALHAHAITLVAHGNGGQDD